VKKAKPARMASLFFSVSELCGVMASQNIMPREPSRDSTPPYNTFKRGPIIPPTGSVISH